MGPVGEKGVLKKFALDCGDGRVHWNQCKEGLAFIGDHASPGCSFTDLICSKKYCVFLMWWDDWPTKG